MSRRTKRSRRPNPREDRNFHTNAAIIELDEFRNKPFKKVKILPRNINQEKFLDMLNDENNHIVIATGPAGSGKTMLATHWAIQQLNQGLVDKIVITRPAVSVDEQHGFLPGSLVEKMEPWVLPILDYFYEYYTKKEVAKLIEDGILEIAPLAYLRGRTFKNSVVLGDEIQNATINQMKMLLTRIGTNSRIVVTGDITQHDRGFENNGLKDFVNRYDNDQGISLVEFTSQDIERHPVIETILDIYK